MYTRSPEKNVMFEISVLIRKGIVWTLLCTIISNKIGCKTVHQVFLAVIYERLHMTKILMFVKGNIFTKKKKLKQLCEEYVSIGFFQDNKLIKLKY